MSDPRTLSFLRAFCLIVSWAWAGETGSALSEKADSR